MFPFLAERFRDGYKAFRTAQTRRLHLFVLKAMVPEPLLNRDARPIFQPDDTQYDLETIDRNVKLAQLKEATGKEVLYAVTIPGTTTPEDEKRIKQHKRQQVRLGLPDVDDPKRAEKTEEILHDMVEAGKLNFHPPGMWSVRTH